MPSNPKRKVVIQEASSQRHIPARQPGPYADVLSAIDQFRAQRCKPSWEPRKLTEYEQEVWDFFELDGTLDHTRLLEECQVRAQMGEGDAKKILGKLHGVHKFRHERRAHRWELPFNHQSWRNLPEVDPDPDYRAPHIWALLIGNDAYLQSPLKAAVKDSEAWKSYLVDFLGVPENQITLIENAKRRTMVNALYDLRDNELIKPGDHILFAYSGQAQSYGAKVYSLEDDINERAGSIEALCPVDRDCDSRNESRVPDISDREVLRILSEIHYQRKADITVVLDCDYSGGFTKANVDDTPVIRAPVIPIEDNVHEMFRKADNHRRRRSSLSVCSPTYATDTVGLYKPAVLAACQDTELAWEGDGHGLFTSAVLRVLRSEKGRGITYSGLIKAIGPLRHDQKPRFDGKDGILFGVKCP